MKKKMLAKRGSVGNLKMTSIPPYETGMKEKIADNKFLYMFIGYLLIYSLIMVALTNMEFSKNLYLFLIPIFFQTLHFYTDMFTWKFSNPYIRENVGKFLYRK